MHASEFQARNKITKEIVAIKKMSYNGKQAAEVSCKAMIKAMILLFRDTFQFCEALLFPFNNCPHLSFI